MGRQIGQVAGLTPGDTFAEAIRIDTIGAYDRAGQATAAFLVHETGGAIGVVAKVTGSDDGTLANGIDVATVDEADAANASTGLVIAPSGNKLLAVLPTKGASGFRYYHLSLKTNSAGSKPTVTVNGMAK